MLRILIFLAVVFILGLGFSWIADNPGLVTITLPKQGDVAVGREIEVSLMVAVVAITATIATMLIIWSMIQTVWRSPEIFTRWRKGRRRDRGYSALSRGMIAAAAGDAPIARKLAKESEKLLSDEPLVALLDAQTALLENNRDVAQSKFETMLEAPETRLLGLRGLYVEAERQGEKDAAAHYAERAMELAPEAPWAGSALLRHQSSSGDWEGALKTLEANRWGNNLGKEANNRLKAVLQTARAMSLEDSTPEQAKVLALSAHKLVPSLVPAAVIAARILSRLGDIRKASKILEATWKLEPHPEIAEAYVHVRSGDSAIDRLKRAKGLAQKRKNHVEGNFAVAEAAIDARDWKVAREALASILRSSPTERACLLMADIEESEHGDRGRMRDWLSRAVRAPRDPAWTADGYISQEWAPISPISGKLDAFEWKVPVELLESATDSVDYSELATEPLPEVSASPATLIVATAQTSSPSDDQLVSEVADNDIDGNSSSTSEKKSEGTTIGTKEEQVKVQKASNAEVDNETKEQETNLVANLDDKNPEGNEDVSEQQPDKEAVAENDSPKSKDEISQADKPIMPDDPGVGEQDVEEPGSSRFKLF